MAKEPNVSIELRSNEPIERALRRFRREVQRAGITRKVKQKRRYEKPSDERRRLLRKQERNRRRAEKKAQQREERRWAKHRKRNRRRSRPKPKPTPHEETPQAASPARKAG